MSKQTWLPTLRGSIPWLLGLVLTCTSCFTARQLTPTPPLMVADFDSCEGINNVGGQMGVAYESPNSLKDTYVEEANRGCVARLEFAISEWSAFWIKLKGAGADLRPYSKMVFDVRADPQSGGIPGTIKLELKRAHGGEVSIESVSGIGTDWKSISVDLADFGPAGYGAPVSVWSGMEELVFTFEASQSGRRGVVYLDNIVFKH